MVQFKPTTDPSAVQIADPAKERPMSLVQALHVLSTAHTRDDDLTGFTVSSHPDLMFVGQNDYIRAWSALRQAIGQSYEPS